MLPFRDAHFCLALAADGNFDAAQRHVESMASFATQESGWRADATRDILIPLCEGMIAHEAGDHDKAIDLMWPIRHDIVAIGGSHAQRDLFAQILCDAAAHSSRLAVARSLLSERVQARSTKKRNWQVYAEVLSALGETERASAARKQAQIVPEAGA
jgi:hypothetical protein